METPDYISRDVSWLYFNHRVLQEAADERVPLYERIKFLAIYSSNLDEFFRVRVASLRSFRELKKETRREMAVKPKRELKQIRRIVQEQQTEFGRIFRKEILPELRERNIFLINDEDFDLEQQAFARSYFEQEIRPLLELQLIETGQEIPFLRNKGLYFILQLEQSEQLGLVNIPSDTLPRFHMLPGRGAHHYLTFLDDIIRFNLERFVQQPIGGIYAVKLSRDAELYIDDEYQGDLLAKIKHGLEERNVGLPTRFLYDSQIPDELLDRMKELFQLRKPDLIPGARYHNFNDFFGFPDPTHSPELHYEPMPPLPHPVLEHAASITATLQERDLLVHFPYQRYDYVPRWIWEAANDPQVRAIRITLYRVASDSEIVKGLLQARKAGKAVTAFIEAKARFDESTNIFWGEQLEEAGAQVIYSFPDIKVHTKLLLISREEEGQLRHYAYIGTGNFNEKTARIYCDHALLTADPRLGNDVERVFSLLERRVIIPKCKHLLVAPFTLRSGFEALVDREIEHARAGREAYLILKMNALEDPLMVEKLYEASRAGVRIQLIIRGVCSLVPGLEGKSETIEAVSIIDRFLEHARLYLFGNGGREELYLASADWMTRNLDQRVEVAAPILDRDLFRELRNILDIQLNDNVRARKIEISQTNPYRLPTSPAEPLVRSQIAIYRYLQQKVKPLHKL